MILNLILKGKWYDMIDSGAKTEEYREIKPYWIRRLCSSGKGHDVDGDTNDYSYCKDCMKCFNRLGEDWCVYPFDQVCFHRGYTSKCMTFEVKSASYGIGKPEWGAPENKSVFIIELGRRIENEKDYLRKWKGTKECENVKAWHEILLEDAEQFSRKLKEKELKNNNNHEA